MSGGTGAVIRAATVADAPRMLEIYAWYVAHTAVSFEYVAPTLAEFEARIRQKTRRYPWLALEADGRVMGYAYAGALYARAAYDWCCEVSIYLDRAARRRGYGRQLYAALEEALRGMGMRGMYACVAVPSGREDEYLTWDSARFHERLGFAQAGRFHCCGWKFGRWYDIVWLEKRIGGDDAPARPPFEREGTDTNE